MVTTYKVTYSLHFISFGFNCPKLIPHTHRVKSQTKENPTKIIYLIDSVFRICFQWKIIYLVHSVFSIWFQWKSLKVDISLRLSKYPNYLSRFLKLIIINSISYIYIYIYTWCCYCSVTKPCLTLCDPHGLQHARPLCPSVSPRVCPIGNIYLGKMKWSRWFQLVRLNK